MNSCYVNEYGIAPHYALRTEAWKLIHYQGSIRDDDGIYSRLSPSLLVFWMSSVYPAGKSRL
jgi:hypothetical protein